MVLDASFKIVVWVFQASGVDEEKLVVNAGHYIVASGSLFSGHDRDIFTRETVQKAGFACVSLANKGDDWKFFHTVYYIIDGAIVFLWRFLIFWHVFGKNVNFDIKSIELRVVSIRKSLLFR